MNMNNFIASHGLFIGQNGAWSIEPFEFKGPSWVNPEPDPSFPSFRFALACGPGAIGKRKWLGHCATFDIERGVTPRQLSLKALWIRHLMTLFPERSVGSEALPGSCSAPKSGDWFVKQHAPVREWLLTLSKEQIQQLLDCLNIKGRGPVIRDTSEGRAALRGAMSLRRAAWVQVPLRLLVALGNMSPSARGVVAHLARVTPEFRHRNGWTWETQFTVTRGRLVAAMEMAHAIQFNWAQVQHTTMEEMEEIAC